jgi:hypothetical protein
MGKDEKLSKQEIADLTIAVDMLENLSFGIKVANVIGIPIETAIQKLPAKWQPKIAEVTSSVLRYALKQIVKIFNKKPNPKPHNFFHKFAVAATGAASGFFGDFAIAIELPITTMIMIHSIADVAKSEGEDLQTYETQLACLEVLALGGNSKNNAISTSNYLSVRAAMAKAIAEATTFLLEKGLTEEGSPIIVKLIANLSERFAIQVSEKFAAQIVPIIGAATGASINLVFISHFQNMAKGHFIYRRLVNKYGEEIIEKEYKKILEKLKIK